MLIITQEQADIGARLAAAIEEGNAEKAQLQVLMLGQTLDAMRDPTAMPMGASAMYLLALLLKASAPKIQLAGTITGRIPSGG